ncbi:MAG TPA: hypothetical protein VG873_03975 [Burkholderiales bacterium]|nr:hypothetical protein [Burkholderiales bacterium]
MQTRTVLCLLLSLASGFASAQWQEDPAKQHARDAARKTILEDELAAEAKLFVEAHSERSAERMGQHRRNLAALTRELARGEAEVEKASIKRPAGGRPDWLISP